MMVFTRQKSCLDEKITLLYYEEEEIVVVVVVEVVR